MRARGMVSAGNWFKPNSQMWTVPYYFAQSTALRLEWGAGGTGESKTPVFAVNILSAFNIRPL